tara:strand:- start:385 stop:579 length:195 start_codon:yes stop_codon:yes gene_type:complete
MLRRILIRYEWLIFMGALIAILAACNGFGITTINSDFFWSIAGAIVVGEGAIELYYESKEDEEE